jgi:hypothetical protein
VGLIFTSIHSVSGYEYIRVFPDSDSITHVEYASQPLYLKENIYRATISTETLYSSFNALDAQHIIQLFQEAQSKNSGHLGYYIIADESPELGVNHWRQSSKIYASMPLDLEISRTINDVISKYLR